MSRESWHVPAEREPGVLYMHGHPGTDYAAVDAIEVDGQRFERVMTCSGTLDYDSWFICDNCGCQTKGDQYGERPKYCASCGREVVDA